MMPAPLVSVIIPTYNRADVVGEAINSVLAQTCRDFELIVVDDGSEDGTAAILAHYQDRIRIIRQARRQGVSTSRNTGARQAGGEWLAFLDSDDLWLPRKLEVQLAFIGAHRGVDICQTEEVWLRRGVRVNPGRRHRKRGGSIFLPSLELCLVSPSAVMLRRQVFWQVGGFDETLPACEDYDLWLRLAWRVDVNLIPEPLVVKRGGRPDQLSRQWGLDRFRVQALLKLMGDADLPEHYRTRVRDTLTAKATVYAQGCARRGKSAEADYYYRLAEWAREAAVNTPSTPFGLTGEEWEPCSSHAHCGRQSQRFEPGGG
ncbi:glycosyltransferase family 2 protein [Desulfobacca acetoxidans]|uniref:Glycosyl transferase family 2 n=1 Tax=Desulfobacca acetoxidans (strain ATCC 700848 / DSM 11109 / ASRB2) TaxID=880072 RepID=F2NER9_DESAR|nr:glycosyltransferase family A protein [Desulfobacca acetoxidans]AEB08259.1 glycosyl transferase family 2 [Desulfobacca acetoxidans DSM 11109]